LPRKNNFLLKIQKPLRATGAAFFLVDFSARDLAGADGVATKGEMNNHTKDRFDAEQLRPDPCLIIFGLFVKWQP
jgi:hypothetical protein